MKHLIYAVMAYLMFSAGPVAQDYDKGYDAAKIGDYKTALKEWRPLAEKKNALAQYQIGLLYQHGKGVSKNLVKATTWYRLAAKQNLAQAQSSLGNFYLLGRGVKRDFKKALYWSNRAAFQGEAAAQTRLAFILRYGKGTKRNIPKSLIWYKKAAEQGYAPAQDSLATIYATGKIVRRSYLLAFKWLKISTFFGSKKGPGYRNWVSKKLTVQEKTEAYQLAQKWIAAYKNRNQIILSK